MSIFSQIELFREIPVEGQLHQIRLVNPTFSLSGEVAGNWSQGHSVEWSFTAGTGTASFTDNGVHGFLRQDFPNPIRDNTWYTVSFTVSSRTTGGVRLYMGGLPVTGVTVNGSYEIPYWSSSGSSHATYILFQPNDDGGTWFDGEIDAVSIVQDRRLSPPESSTQWEPVGFLDMDDRERLGVTYTVSDVKSITKRFGAWSKVFKLPRTPTNAALLGHLHSNEAQPSVFDPRNKTKAVLWSDDVPQVRGYLSLKSVSDQGELGWFEVELVDGGVDLVDAIKGKKLSDLDLSAYAHPLTRDNIVQTWQDGWTWENGYYYPLYLNEDDRFRVKDDFKPAYFNRAILKAIFDEANYSFDLSPELEEKFDLVLTAPTGRPKAGEGDLEASGARASSSADTVYQANGDTSPPIFVNDNGQVALDVEESDPLDNFYPASGFFIAPFTGPYTVEYLVTTTIAGSQQTPTSGDRVIDGSTDYSDIANSFVSFDVWDYSANVALLGPDQGRWEFPQQYTAPYSQARIFSGQTTTLDLVAGQIVCLNGRVQNRLQYFDNIAHWGTDLTVTVDHTETYFSIRPSAGVPITEGMLISAPDWLGKITQQSFLEDQIRAFNLHLVPDPDNERLIHIFSRNELYGTDEVIDRSGCVAMDEEITREYLSEITASKLVLGHKTPISSDAFNEHWTELAGESRIYGDKEFSFGTNLYIETTETRLANYTPAPITVDNGGRFVSAVLSRGEDADTKLLVRCPETYPSEVLVSWYSPNVGSYYTTPYAYYRPTLHVDRVTGSTFSLTFGEVPLLLTSEEIDITSNTLFSDHYQDQLDQWKNSRLFSCYMRLSNAQVGEHLRNIGAHIFVEELGNWFHLYSIIDWDPTLSDSVLTRVVLLEAPPSNRAIRRQYFQRPPNKISGFNPLITAGVSGQDFGTTVFGTRTSIYNTNVGFNTLRTENYYNSVYGSGNTVNNNANYNFILGDNNTISAGVSGVTMLGGVTNVTALTSNTTYLGPNYIFSPSGATFFGSSGVTIGNTSTNFYGSSGVSISATAITINGVVITSASTDHTKVQGGVNTYTAGTESRPSVNVVANPSFSAITVGTGVTISSTGITIQGLTITSGFTSGISGNYLPLTGGTMSGNTTWINGTSIKLNSAAGSTTFIPSYATSNHDLYTPNKAGEIALVPVSREISSDYSVTDSYQYYVCDTSSGGFVVTLPPSPSLTEQYHFFDKRGSWGSDNLTLSGGTNNINAGTSYVLGVDNQHAFVTWIGNKWAIIVTA
jgi:hypothetical protein